MNYLTVTLTLLFSIHSNLLAGEHNTDRNSSRQGRAAAVQKAEKIITFTSDDRPRDGILTEITITNGVAGWTAEIRKAGIDRRTRKEFDKKETLADMLKCNIEAREILCSRDLRPVDGAFTEIHFTHGVAGWTVQKRTITIDRRTGKQIEKIENLGSLLSRKN